MEFHLDHGTMKGIGTLLATEILLTFSCNSNCKAVYFLFLILNGSWPLLGCWFVD